jgi:hypothetical protein
MFRKLHIIAELIFILEFVEQVTRFNFNLFVGGQTVAPD